MRVALVFDRLRDDTIGVYFERACRALGIAYDHVWTREADRSLGSGYDLYLRIDHGDYQEDVPDRLRPKIFYAADTHLPKSWAKIRRLALRYDLVCCVHRTAADSLRNGVWVPVGCDPSLHKAPAMAKRWTVAFVGTEGGVPRKFYLQALRERYRDSFIGHAPHTQLGSIYGQAKIGFNYSIRQDVNMRIFEVLCAGTLLVTNRLAHDDLARLGLVERTHYASYRSPSDLLRVVEHYLTHEEARDAIAARGQALVMARHTYAHRLRQILLLANERFGGRWAVQPLEVATPCAS